MDKKIVIACNITVVHGLRTAATNYPVEIIDLGDPNIGNPDVIITANPEDLDVFNVKHQVLVIQLQPKCKFGVEQDYLPFSIIDLHPTQEEADQLIAALVEKLTPKSKSPFELLFDTVEKTIDFDPYWDNGTGYLDHAVIDKATPYGVVKFVTDGDLPGRKAIRVRISNLQIVMFERGEGSTRIAYNTNVPFRDVFKTLNGGNNHLTDKGMAFFTDLVERSKHLDIDGL